MFGPMRVVFLALGLVLPSGCAPEPAPRASFSGMNLILISVDTLRADRLGCYGYERPTSPAIDDLAESGVRFERVVAESSWTLPSHMTIFSGVDGGRYGVIALLERPSAVGSRDALASAGASRPGMTRRNA
jgi:arylsulfatase A-like enzyme